MFSRISIDESSLECVHVHIHVCMWTVLIVHIVVLKVLNQFSGVRTVMNDEETNAVETKPEQKSLETTNSFIIELLITSTGNRAVHTVSAFTSHAITSGTRYSSDY